MSGSRFLSEIHGYGTGADIDMYRICITNPQNFGADTFQSIEWTRSCTCCRDRRRDAQRRRQ
jgi:hypothetical protein